MRERESQREREGEKERGRGKRERGRRERQRKTESGFTKWGGSPPQPSAALTYSVRCRRTELTPPQSAFQVVETRGSYRHPPKVVNVLTRRSENDALIHCDFTWIGLHCQCHVGAAGAAVSTFVRPGSVQCNTVLMIISASTLSRGSPLLCSLVVFCPLLSPVLSCCHLSFPVSLLPPCILLVSFFRPSLCDLAVGTHTHTHTHAHLLGK